ncbi:thioredoxin domain-containing protein [Dactylosporangium sp. NPDC051484]|uniref:DsbA family protein n=1 Tax=Dactylosporangium sp. NPDC051484 TaxID=3154942 RepID=UPI00344F8EEF
MSKQARIRAHEVRLAQERAEQRRRNRIRVAVGAGGVVIAGLLVAIIAVVFTSASKDAGPSGKLVTPANLTASGAIPVGSATAPVTLEIYLDFMCPACGRFEQANAGELDRLIQAGTVKLELRPMTFLDKTSQGTRYSTRAANALATVADRAPGSVWALSKALYANQPQEGTPGLSDQRIVALAVEAGVTQEVADAFDAGIFKAWAAKSNDDAFKAGIEGTPTVKINGKVFAGNLYTAGPLTEAIEQAAGGAK